MKYLFVILVSVGLSFAIFDLYRSTYLPVTDVSDGDGHGPDFDGTVDASSICWEKPETCSEGTRAAISQTRSHERNAVNLGRISFFLFSILGCTWVFRKSRKRYKGPDTTSNSTD